MRSAPRLVRAEGGPREIGRAHGRAAKAEIAENVALYARRFREEWGLSRDDVVTRGRRIERAIRDADPDYAEAMDALAEASGQDLRDIVALNARYEIGYSAYSALGRAAAVARTPSGCTALALLPERTRGGLVMAQNWDWIPGVRGLVVRYRLEGRPAVLAFTEAGIVGAKIGLNAAGVGLLINGLVSNEDAWDRPGVPFHVRCWQVLQAEDLDGAADVVRSSPASCSSNFLLGEARDGRARVLDLEASPVGVAEIPPEDGALTHANHFCRPEALGIWQPLLEERTSTFGRHRRIDGLLADARRARTAVSADDVSGFLRDHEGRPNSICRHPDEGLREAERYQTVASIVLDVSGRRLLIAGGPPCEAEHRAFRLGAGTASARVRRPPARRGRRSR